ncbi:NAD(P)/FAD-dependent oxidoreductase [Chloroflexota bacterium]
MIAKAEVVIIGAGVVGTSIAYHLAKKGCTDVLVLEKDSIGDGSTAKCAGGIRQQFSTEINIRLAMESVRFFQNFTEETGHTPDFKQNGYLILATTDQEVEAFRQNVAQQKSLGLEVNLLSPEGAKEMSPQLNSDDISGASYCSSDGFADPYQVTHGFASAARKLGVRIQEGTEVIALNLKSGRVRGVVTNKGEIAANTVVNAAGPYAAEIGKMAGVEIPVTPSRRHIFFTTPLSQISAAAPMVIDFHTGFWFRRESQGLMLGMRNPEELPGFDISVDWDFLPRLAKISSHRLPLLNESGIVRGWAGLHADTPDWHAIMGKVPGVEGLICAVGFSGHGFMHSPATGRLIAELILEGSTSIDISPLALERFSGRTCPEEKIFI